MGNGQGEEFVRSLLAGSFTDGERWLVGGAVRVHNNVRHGMFQHQGMEADLGAEQRDDLDFYCDAINAQIGRLIGGFASMNDEIANVYSQPEGDGVQLADFDPAAGRFFERGDYAPPDQPLKGSGGEVPGKQTQNDNAEKDEQSK
jgi:hypothetical protein